MLKLRRGDTIYVAKGKDTDKTGKVLKVLPGGTRVIVEGINLVKKHMKKRSQEQQAGIVSIESPVSISNLMAFCKRCNGPVRVGFNVIKGKKKTRICKKCKEEL